MLYFTFCCNVEESPMWPLNKVIGDWLQNQGLHASYCYDELLDAKTEDSLVEIMALYSLGDLDKSREVFNLLKRNFYNDFPSILVQLYRNKHLS